MTDLTVQSLSEEAGPSSGLNSTADAHANRYTFLCIWSYSECQNTDKAVSFLETISADVGSRLQSSCLILPSRDGRESAERQRFS